MSSETQWWTPIASWPTDGRGPGRLAVQYEVDDWQAVYEISAGDGRFAIASIRIEPRSTDDPPPPLPAAFARGLVRPGEALDRARDFFADVSRVMRPSPLNSYLEAFDETGGKRRGVRVPHYVYAAIAELYVQHLQSGSRTPVADTANGLPATYDTQFVSGALMKARERGLLTQPPAKGKPGGELTRLGQEVLAEGPPDSYRGPAFRSS